MHEPCLYSDMINGKWVIFKRQVDDFAIAAPDAKTADILLDMLDKKLTIPIKRQGFLDKNNGILFGWGAQSTTVGSIFNSRVLFGTCDMY